jgi:hypothetical protein
MTSIPTRLNLLILTHPPQVPDRAIRFNFFGISTSTPCAAPGAAIPAKKQNHTFISPGFERRAFFPIGRNEFMNE